MSRSDHATPKPTWFELLAVPVLLGAVTGLCVGVMVDIVERYLLEKVILGIPGIWFALPAAAIFVLTRLIMTKVAGSLRPSTSELYPVCFHREDIPYPVRQVPGRVLAGAATVGLGGSQGLEAVSAMIGDGLGITLRRWIGHRFPYLTSVDGRRLLLSCGAAAGIATVFSSPILGAAYGIEMPFRRSLDGRRLIPCFLAAAASFLTASMINSSRSLVTYIPHQITLREMAGVALVAIGCGAGARLFAVTAGKIQNWRFGSQPWLRVVGAGIVLAGMSATIWLITGAAVNAGPGYVAASWALPSHGIPPAAWLLICALLFRSAGVLLCIAAGGGGGVFTSLATNGLLIGTAVAVLMDLPNPTLLALVGCGAFLGAGYRIPLAGAGMIVELSGAALPSALGLAAVGIAWMMMGHNSASAAQRDPGDPGTSLRRIA